MEKLNYIFFIPETAFGGLEIQTVKRARDIKKAGHNAILLTLKNSRIEKLALEMGLEVKHIKIIFKYVDFFSVYKLGKIFSKYNANICIVSKSEHLSIATLSKNLFSKHTIVIYYNQLETNFCKRDFFHNWVYRNLNAAITLTELMKKELSEYTIFPQRKIEVISYGIDLEKFNPRNHDKIKCRKYFNLPLSSFLIGLPGRTTDSKGQDIAIKAFAKANIPNSYLVFCGDKGNTRYYEQLMDLAKKESVIDRLIHLPFTENINIFMNAIDISILPSKKEAFGLVVIEAMASGIPVIATNAGGVPEIITHNSNGLLFEPFDYKKLAEYLIILHKEPDLRSDLGNKALENTKIHYDGKIQTKKFIDFTIKVFENKLYH
jgi:glycosyltransferase involved in cell wall biosynthesis